MELTSLFNSNTPQKSIENGGKKYPIRSGIDYIRDSNWQPKLFTVKSAYTEAKKHIKKDKCLNFFNATLVEREKETYIRLNYAYEY